MKKALLSIVLAAVILSACGKTSDMGNESETSASISETTADIITTAETSETEMSAETETEISAESETQTSDETDITPLDVITPEIKIDITDDFFTDDSGSYIISVYSDGSYKCLSDSECSDYINVETVNEILEKKDLSSNDSDYEQYRLELMDRFEVGEEAFADYDRTECKVQLIYEHYYGDNDNRAAAKTAFGYVMTAVNDNGIKLERSAVTGKPCTLMIVYTISGDVIFLTASYSTDDGWEQIIYDDTVSIVY